MFNHTNIRKTDMNINRLFQYLTVTMLMVATACTPMPSGEVGAKSLSIEYEKYTLANGLEVILHEDHSDPIVAVAIQLHVGSNREKPKSTW